MKQFVVLMSILAIGIVYITFGYSQKLISVAETMYNKFSRSIFGKRANISTGLSNNY